jgi:hypothetical protein
MLLLAPLLFVAIMWGGAALWFDGPASRLGAVVAGWWLAIPARNDRDWVGDVARPAVAISIETRKEKGEGYSAVLGFFRQYELYYVAADERDVIRVRTNVRGEHVFLYRIQMHHDDPPSRAGRRSLESVGLAHPRQRAPRRAALRARVDRHQLALHRAARA